MQTQDQAEMANNTQDQAEMANSGGQAGRQNDQDSQRDQGTGTVDVAALQRQIDALQAELDRREQRIRELNSESASRRVDNKTLAQRLDEIQQALEQERQQREAAQRAAQEAAKKAERAQLVADLQTRYKLPARLAERLVGETPEELEADAKALAEELGTLVRGAGVARQAGSTGNSTWGGSLTLEKIATMTPEEINENWDEVSKFLASGA